MFFGPKPKSGRLVDAPGRYEETVGPERQALVTKFTRRPDAFLHQPPTNAEPPSRWFDVEQAKLGKFVRASSNQVAS